MTDTSRDELERIRQLLKDVLARRLSVSDFCVSFERHWNFEIDQKLVRDDEFAALDHLFDVVALHSPYPKEEWGYPGYRTDEDVLQAAEEAARIVLAR